jgi:hypothetical protein
MPSSGMLRCVDFVRTDVSEDRSATIISVTRNGEVGRTLTITGNRRMLQRDITLCTVFLSVRRLYSVAFFMVTTVKTQILHDDGFLSVQNS